MTFSSQIRYTPLIKLVAGIIGIFLVIGLIAGLLSISTLKSAKDDLTQAKDLLSQVSNDPSSLLSKSGLTQDDSLLSKAVALSGQAASAISDSSTLNILKYYPVVGTQRGGILDLARDARTASIQAHQLVTQITSLSNSSGITNGHIPLARLAQLTLATQKARGIFQQLVRSPDGLIGPIYSARQEFNRAANKVSSRLSTGAQDLVASQEFLGSQGSRNYLIVGENNAEMRDQGMALSYSTVSFSNGTFTTGASQDTGNIEPARPVSIAIPKGTQEIFGGLNPTGLWQSTNATADFSWSAQVMAKMYQEASNSPVDGVIALDVPALSNLLAVTGPVSVPGIGQPISSSNVSEVLLNQLYQNAPTSVQQEARRDDIANVASTVMSQLRNTSGSNMVKFANALAKSAAGGHLMLWSSDPQIESIFNQTGLGGDISRVDPQRTVHVAVENATATKLDYFVHPIIDVNVQITGSNTAKIGTSVVINNQAPVGAKPSYQLGPDDINSFTPGQYVARVYFWGPSSGQQPASVSESGLELNQIPVSVQAGQSGLVAFETSIANAVQNGSFYLRFVPQPRLFPVTLNVKIAGKGWKISGPSKQSLTLDKTIFVTWKLTRK